MALRRLSQVRRIRFKRGWKVPTSSHSLTVLAVLMVLTTIGSIMTSIHISQMSGQSSVMEEQIKTTDATKAKESEATTITAATEARKEPEHEKNPENNKMKKNSSTAKKKILLFITTVFSQQHQDYLKCCWPRLVKESKLLQQAHVMIFSSHNRQLSKDKDDNKTRNVDNNKKRNDAEAEAEAETVVDDEILQYTQSLFEDNGISFEYKFPKPEQIPNDVSFRFRFQQGANLGLQLGFAEGWFEPYEWLIRINPDVIIRDSTFMLQAMDDPKVDGIFQICSFPHYKLHTDFFAARIPTLLQHEREEWMEEEQRQGAVRKHYSNENSTIFGQMWPVYNPHVEMFPPLTTKQEAAAKLNKSRWNRPNHERTAFETFRFMLEQHDPKITSFPPINATDNQLSVYKKMRKKMRGKKNGRQKPNLPEQQQHEGQEGAQHTHHNDRRVIFVPNADPSVDVCRIRGVKSPIYHAHDSCLNNVTAAIIANENSATILNENVLQSTPLSQIRPRPPLMVCSALEGWSVA